MIWSARAFLVIFLVLCLGAASIVAGEADDDYLRLFQEMRRAEQLEQQGKHESARAAFVQVRSGLLAFQESYPTWYPEILAYRLRYVMAAQERLGVDRSAADLVDDAPARVETEDLLRARLGQLELEREELKARLREALAAKPAVVSSPELTAAEERIRVLEKELALHRFAAQAEQPVVGAANANAAGGSDASLDGAAGLRLESVQAELALEREKVALLTSAATDLQQRLKRLEEERVAGETNAAALSVPAIEEKGEDVLGRARDYMARGESDKAIQVLATVAQDAEADCEVLSLLGRALFEKGLAGPAEAVLRRALGKDSSCAEAHLLMSRICLMLSPSARSLARWHYHEARRYGAAPDTELESHF